MITSVISTLVEVLRAVVSSAAQLFGFELGRHVISQDIQLQTADLGT